MARPWCFFHPGKTGGIRTEQMGKSSLSFSISLSTFLNASASMDALHCSQGWYFNSSCFVQSLRVAFFAAIPNAHAATWSFSLHSPESPNLTPGSPGRDPSADCIIYHPLDVLISCTGFQNVVSTNVEAERAKEAIWRVVTCFDLSARSHLSSTLIIDEIWRFSDSEVFYKNVDKNC